MQLENDDQRFAAWMKAALAGDRAAYERLLRAAIPFIKMVVRSQGVPADFVDDVVQDTLLTIHRVRQTYDSGRSFLAWLRTIAQRRAFDVIRSLSRRNLREVHEPIAFENHADPMASPEGETQRSERANFVNNALAALPAKQRQAVEQLALRERSAAEAARATGLTPGALRVNLHRGLRTLRARVAMAA
jgi:RNA polymerase sigma factor (sigma-70 family)